MSLLVAVADPDPVTRSEMTRALAQAEFTVLEAGDGVHALRQVFTSHPGVIVMELNLPRLGGLELVRALRAASDIGIIVVSDGHAPTAARVLDAGADDYIARPVGLAELVARVRATARRIEHDDAADGEQPADQVVRTGALTIDREAQVVTRHGVQVGMTRTEHLLLGSLAQRIGQVCTHRFLLSNVWGGEYIDDTHYLRGYVASLRAKLEDDPAHPRLLLTEWGTGYRLAAIAPAAQRADERVNARLADAAS
ncbi:MAG: response regulator transcription factor [Chloroflexi bacterium]|nr:response regulator transcription factor [Chloroflexota bacterium]